MMAPRQQFAYSSTHSTVDLSQRFVPERAIVSVNSKLVSRAVERPCGESSSLDHAFDKILNKRNAIIAQFIMLILLPSLQAPVYCDDIVTCEILPATVEQTLRAAPVPLTPVNNPAPVPDAAIVKVE